MTPHRPEIFISATSADLKSCRQIIKESLLTLGCTPVEQTNFPPAASSVREMLRSKIADCDALIHLAGEVYGAEPQERGPDEPRRSYTQMEYEMARELGKPVYVIVCGEEFPYDEHEPEDAERRQLQQQHRQRLQAGDHLFSPVSSPDGLELAVHQLQTRVDKLATELKRSRRRLGRSVLAGVMFLIVLSVGLWRVNRQGAVTEERVTQTEEQITEISSELEQQRGYLKQVADVYSKQQSELAELKLTDREKYDRALARVAEEAGLPEAELRASIDLFVATVTVNDDADFYDRALAEFAQQHFAAAAAAAGQAVDEARRERLAAEKLVDVAHAQAEKARSKERDALTLQGQSFAAGEDYAAAVDTFQQALAITSRDQWPVTWIKLQWGLGVAATIWARRSTGAAIHERRSLAIAAYRAALEVRTRAGRPLGWGVTQHNLAITLKDQAGSATGAERAQLLRDAVTACRAALEFRTRADLPQKWAQTQNNLASTLVDQARASAGPERAQLLQAAVTACRDVLEVYTRADLPQKWAQTQNILANALSDQAETAAGDQRAQLLQASVTANRAALEVQTRSDLPQEWAKTQNNLANGLRVQAETTEGVEQAQLLQASVTAYRAALEIRTRADLPQGWALTQNNLAIALKDQSESATGAERAQLLRDAVTAYQEVLKVYTRTDMPQDWAMMQNNLAVLLWSQAETVEGTERAQLLQAAVAAMQGALEIHAAELPPAHYALRAKWIAAREAEIKELEGK